jgi:Protein of unknown function (DUF2442)
MLHVTSATYIDGYRIRVEFNNGYCGIADFEDSFDGPIFFPLRDTNYFRTFRLEGHTLSWLNGADFAPEYVLELTRDANTTEQNVGPKADLHRSRNG